MEILEKLFGSENRVKLMRLFVFNPDTPYIPADIAVRSKINPKDLRRELSALLDIGLIKKRIFMREIVSKRKKGVDGVEQKDMKEVKKIEEHGFMLDQNFDYLPALKNLIITASLHADEKLLKRFTNIGRLKLFIASGLFIQEWDARVDLLVVGDEPNMNRLEHIMKSIEAEVGKEITYSAFETTDFEYRHGVHDRLVRDILDMPHIVLVDKLGIEEHVKK